MIRSAPVGVVLARWGAYYGKDPAPLLEAVKDGVLALKPHLGEDEVWVAWQT